MSEKPELFMRAALQMLSLLHAVCSSAVRVQPGAQLQCVRRVATHTRSYVVAQAGGRASAAVVQSEKSTTKSEGSSKKEPMDLQPPRGTRDFYPDEMALRNWLFGKMRETAVSHA